MSRKLRHIKSHYNTTYEESYVNLQKPTNATFKAKETMDTKQINNVEKKEETTVTEKKNLEQDTNAIIKGNGKETK